MKVKKLIVCSSIIALSLVCSKIKIMSLPLGGSVTLFSMLIISMAGYFYGIKYGMISSFIYSLLKLLLGGCIYSPIQAIIDYIFSYSCFGITGFLTKTNKKHLFIIIYLMTVTLRFIFSCISGMVFFIEYAPSSMNPLLYTIVYNGSYIYLEAIFSIILILIIPKNIIKSLINISK